MASKRKILVAMSGGVDSSVAAAVLREAGHEVVGVFMRMGVEREEGEGETPASRDSTHGNQGTAAGVSCEERPGTAVRGHDGASKSCCSAADAADARVVAARLGIPFYVLNFAEPFAKLIDHFVAEYNRGRTPNPCVLCNSELKFGRLFDYADSIGADAVATGHYARVIGTPSGPRLARGLDPAKDQSYVLFGIAPATVGRIVLPLGDWTKDRVRAKAAELGLPVAAKPDSQEICFVPDDDYAALVRRRSPEAVRPGPVLDAAGRQIGTHPGHQHFTIGQRRGLRIAAGKPVYVTAIDPAANAVTLGPADALLRRELTCSQVNWLVDVNVSCQAASGAADGRGSDETSLRAEVRIRYHTPAAAATVFVLPERRARVVFDAPVSAVTPGQAAVFYDADGLLIGGGWID